MISVMAAAPVDLACAIEESLGAEDCRKESEPRFAVDANATFVKIMIRSTAP
jgi:hypothetical protein